ncbi:unnamed protein product [Tuber aestivum]|uniref:Uncharacterized protein n=1 Tax=Tuber aestivum TaxID=59557 RepID=A0A292PQL3_9PEZI|nr:unnamed protein product [Tuber aestivum]
MVMDRDEGFIVTLEGHQPTITEQLQLLPFSQNILCLPPLDLPPPPPPRKSASPSSSPSSQNQFPVLDSVVRKYILSLHDAHVSRVQKAKRFLSERSKGTGRMVFMNGGFAAAQVACLEALKHFLAWEGDEMEMGENATREAEWMFQDIMHGGVQALQCNPLDGSKADGLKKNSCRESISDKVHRRMRSESAATRSREEIPEEEAAIPRPVTPVDKFPGSPMSGSQSTAWASAAEKMDPVMSKSSHLSLATIATVSTTAPRSPTPEEIEAGIEIGKAVAVHVRSRSNTTNTVAPPRYSPPPSPPVMRSESRRGSNEDRLRERRRSQSIPPYCGRNRRSVTGKTLRRKDTSSLKISTMKPDDPVLPLMDTVYSPMDIITPPSSAGVLPETPSSDQPSTYHHRSIGDSFGHIGARDSVPSTRTASPTPSSTEDASGATIMPSPLRLGRNFTGSPPSVIGRLAGEPVDPLFPSADDNLIIYLSDEIEKGSNELLERVLGDLSASFTIRTPGTCSREEPERRFLPAEFRPQHISTKHESYRSYESIASTETTRWSLGTTSSRGGNTADGGERQGSHFPTVRLTSQSSPLDLQNELRGILRQHFPIPASPVPAADDDDEETRWLREDDEISALWAPVLSPYSSPASGSQEDTPCSAIDLLMAIGSETTLSSGAEIDLAAQKGEELRHQLISRTEKEVSKRKDASGFSNNRVSRVSLKYLLCTSHAFVLRQHPEAANLERSIVKGGFLLPMIEKYISQNADVRALIIDFDLHMGSQAILELRRHLHCPTYTPETSDTSPAVLRIACIADGAIQISAKPPVRKFPNASLRPAGGNAAISPTATSSTNQIRIRTSYGQTTTSYTLSGWTPTSPNIPADALRIRRSMRRRKDRNWVPKQRLISLADVLLPPLGSVPAGPGFVAAVGVLVSGVVERERVTGFFGDKGDEERGWRGEDRRRKWEDRRGSSYFDDEEDEEYGDEGEGQEGEEGEEEEEEEGESEVDDERSTMTVRGRGGSKAFRWLGLV